MTAKLFSTTALSFISIVTLSAQTPVQVFHHGSGNESDLGNVVNQLGENALSILIGMVVLIGIVWFLAICKACIGLNKKQKNSSVSSMLLWFAFAIFTSVVSSSCSAEQLARAAEMQTTQAPEGGYCICNATGNTRPYFGNTATYNQYPYNILSTGGGRPFCRQCGRRVFNYNR